MSGFSTRWATEADLDRLRAASADVCGDRRLRAGFLLPEQIAASLAVMGLDTQLIRDGLYLIVDEEGVAVGCGGWNRRATLGSGDHSAALRDPVPLDPPRDPARIRAMYTPPDHAQRGIGRLILARCEAAAAAAGFCSAELMAPLSGEPLYRARGDEAVERA